MSYLAASEQYAAFGVDTDKALEALANVPVSLHCWQGDDVGGFEKADAMLSGGGIQATGSYLGKARSLCELQADLDQALSLIPGRKRLNLHACYADLNGDSVDRDGYSVAHFQTWIDWCKERGMGMDFNPSFFSHPLASDGLTLSHPDPSVRSFWIAHGIACRKIAEEAARQLGTPAVTNFWIPDGSKDIPFDRKGPRERLESALDTIFLSPVDRSLNLDAVESKLFGIGSESYVVGSHEFYLAYAVKHGLLYCLDAGHFHPTENLADKISSVLQFVPRILLHVSRGVRWDSDHVVLFDDPTRSIMEEVVRGGFLSRTHIGLDFFDASINRIAAWVIGTRATLKCLLAALLEPCKLLHEAEKARDHTLRLVILEETKGLPFGAVWDEFCSRSDVPLGMNWIKEVKHYEKSVLAAR